jgi:hypothetical protein
MSLGRVILPYFFVSFVSFCNSSQPYHGHGSNAQHRGIHHERPATVLPVGVRAAKGPQVEQELQSDFAFTGKVELDGCGQYSYA